MTKKFLSVRRCAGSAGKATFAARQPSHFSPNHPVAIANLVIDIGNTRTKAAVFRQGHLQARVVWAEPTVALVEALAYNQNVQNVILSSVAKVPPAVEAFLQASFFYLPLSTETPLPLAVQYGTPHTLGKDRIAAAVGAAQLYPGEHLLVIDAGTCITLDVVDGTGTFRGGNISPGIDLRLRAMHHFTARLPLLQPSDRRLATGRAGMPDWLGGSTEQAVRNGAELGALLEVQGFVQKCRRQFRPLRVVFTGGSADFFVKNLKTKIFAHPDLVLIGLDKILNHNVEKSEGL